MPLRSRTRKALLLAHLLTSLGWVGVVVIYLTLAVVGISSSDPQLVRAVYLVMDWASWSVLVPFAVASLLTGVASALGTPWGLVRHYWVLFKLVLTLVATVVLLLYTRTFTAMAIQARNPSVSLEMVRNASPVLHGAGALVVLLTATVLAVYKPRGTTGYGLRRR